MVKKPPNTGGPIKRTAKIQIYLLIKKKFLSLNLVVDMIGKITFANVTLIDDHFF
jgi:hypothetical protein